MMASKRKRDVACSPDLLEADDDGSAISQRAGFGDTSVQKESKGEFSAYRVTQLKVILT